MDREEAILKLTKKFCREETLDLIERIERDGSPIQIAVKIRIDSPDTMELFDSESCVAYQCFGNFRERPVKVERVQYLESKYEPDISLLEGNWNSLNELRKRIDELNVFYKFPEKGLSKKVHEMLAKKFGGLGYPAKHQLYEPHPKKEGYDIKGDKVSKGFMPKFSMPEICDFLSSQGIVFLRYNMVAMSDRIYDDISEFDRPSDGPKTADISLNLL